MSERGELETVGKKYASELGVELVTRGVSNDDLRLQVDKLKETKIERDEAKKREADIAKKAGAAKLESLNSNVNDFRGFGLKFEFQVAPGKKLQCKVGVLVSGARVLPEYVGGDKELAKLVVSGAVLKRA